MSNEITKEFELVMNLMEKARLIIAKDELKEQKPQFYLHIWNAKEKLERILNIIDSEKEEVTFLQNNK